MRLLLCVALAACQCSLSMQVSPPSQAPAMTAVAPHTPPPAPPKSAPGHASDLSPLAEAMHTVKAAAASKLAATRAAAGKAAIKALPPPVVKRPDHCFVPKQTGEWSHDSKLWEATHCPLPPLPDSADLLKTLRSYTTFEAEDATYGAHADTREGSKAVKEAAAEKGKGAWIVFWGDASLAGVFGNIVAHIQKLDDVAGSVSPVATIVDEHASGCADPNDPINAACDRDVVIELSPPSAGASAGTVSTGSSQPASPKQQQQAQQPPSIRLSFRGFTDAHFPLMPGAPPKFLSDWPASHTLKASLTLQTACHKGNVSGQPSAVVVSTGWLPHLKTAKGDLASASAACETQTQIVDALSALPMPTMYIGPQSVGVQVFNKGSAGSKKAEKEEAVQARLKPMQACFQNDLKKSELVTGWHPLLDLWPITSEADLSICPDWFMYACGDPKWPSPVASTVLRFVADFLKPAQLILGTHDAPPGKYYY